MNNLSIESLKEKIKTDKRNISRIKFNLQEKQKQLDDNIFKIQYLERYGELNIHNSIKNNCQHHILPFNPDKHFYDVLQSSASIDGWLRYNQPPL